MENYVHCQDYLREAVLGKSDQSGFCEDGGRFYWLAIRRQDKIKLQKKSISVVKTPDKEIVICKDSELSILSAIYMDTFVKERRSGDKVLLSPNISKKEKHYTYEILGFIPKEPLVKKLFESIERRADEVANLADKIVELLIKKQGQRI